MIIFAYSYILLCLLCSLLILVDIIRHPQDMQIMNVVWPVTALYGGPLAVWAYYRTGRSTLNVKKQPFWQAVLKARSIAGVAVPWVICCLLLYCWRCR